MSSCATWNSWLYPHVSTWHYDIVICRLTDNLHCPDLIEMCQSQCVYYKRSLLITLILQHLNAILWCLYCVCWSLCKVYSNEVMFGMSWCVSQDFSTCVCGHIFFNFLSHRRSPSSLFDPRWALPIFVYAIVLTSPSCRSAIICVCLRYSLDLSLAFSVSLSLKSLLGILIVSLVCVCPYLAFQTLTLNGIMLTIAVFIKDYIDLWVQVFLYLWSPTFYRMGHTLPRP